MSVVRLGTHVPGSEPLMRFAMTRVGYPEVAAG